MTLKSSGFLRAAVLAGAVFAASPAFAETSADIIADEFIAYGAAQMAQVTVGARDRSGDTLRLSDVRYKVDNENVGADVVIDWIDFRELGADSVAITFAPTIVGTVQGKKEPGGMTLSFANDGLVYTVSGTPDARNYNITGTGMKVTAKLLGGPPELEDFNMVFDLAGLGGNALMLDGPGGTIKSTLTASTGALNYLLTGDNMKFDLTSEIADLVMSYEGDLVSEETVMNLFSGDKGLAMNMATGAYTARGDVLTPDGMAMNFDSSVESSQAIIAIGNGGLNYDIVGKGAAYRLSSSALPIPPVDLEMSEFGVRFAMPMGKAGTTGALGMRLTMRDLLVSEGLWAMIDPGKVLPREPATLNMDVSGTATTKVDFSNPQAMAALGGRPPMDVSDVSINDITLQIAGAELLATGAATIDNSGPIPVPAGKVNASLRGANGLIDKLMQLGLLTPQQAMPARMMMGMFAIPGDGPDHLTSEIVFQPDGRILANGVPLR